MSDKNQAAAFVRELVSAESCYPPLRELGEEWLAAVGTDRESDLSAKLIAALEEDVNTIDDSLSFFASEAGMRHFGKEKAEEMIAAFTEAKANGSRYCLCPACSAGAAILAHRELFG